MTVCTKPSCGPTPYPHQLAANFRLHWELVGGKNILKALSPFLLLVALIVLLVPVSLVLYLNAQHEAKLGALYDQVQSLQHELNLLRRQCNAISDRFDVNDSSPDPEKNEIGDVGYGIKESKYKFQPLDLNASLSHQHQENHSVRHRRAAPKKQLIQCPNTNKWSAKQFRGDMYQFIPNNGFITNWKEEVWCNDSKNANKIVWDSKSGGIEIMESGVYQINAQLTFVRFDTMADFVIQVQPEGSGDMEDVSRCRVSKDTNDDDVSPKTCSSSLLLCLNKNDKIFVFVPLANLMINLDKISSYIGLSRLTKLRSCPPISTIMSDLK